MDPAKDRTTYPRERKLGDEVMRHGPWDQRRAEQIVRGFYKFNVPGVELTVTQYAVMREVDPGLPDWEAFLGLLADSELRGLVQTS